MFKPENDSCTPVPHLKMHIFLAIGYVHHVPTSKYLLEHYKDSLFYIGSDYLASTTVPWIGTSVNTLLSCKISCN
jgi:hypothetical protein